MRRLPNRSADPDAERQPISEPRRFSSACDEPPDVMRRSRTPLLASVDSASHCRQFINSLRNLEWARPSSLFVLTLVVFPLPPPFFPPFPPCFVMACIAPTQLVLQNSTPPSTQQGMYFVRHVSHLVTQGFLADRYHRKTHSGRRSVTARARRRAQISTSNTLRPFPRNGSWIPQHCRAILPRV